MKKYITLLIISFLAVTLAFGQCIPDPQYTLPGIYPDSATNLPHAFATYEYNAVFTAIIPADTMLLPGLTLRIDSIGVTDIQGLPEGFQAIPSRPSAFWHGGTSGCMLITGTPTEAQVGTYPLQITVVGYIGGLGLPNSFVIDYYSITVLPAATYGIDEEGLNGNIRMKAFPNPSSDIFNLEFYAQSAGNFECLIYDSRGRLLKSETISTDAGNQSYSIDGSDLEPGIYFCRLSHTRENLSAVIRLIRH